VGSFAPRPTCPTPANFACALVATHGEQGWIMGVRNWMNKDAECCSSMHACITLRRFCTAHDKRTRQTTHAESTSGCTHVPARCSAHMYTSTHAQARDAYTHMHTSYDRTSLQHSAHFALWYVRAGGEAIACGPVQNRTQTFPLSLESIKQ
jgi:hypothetical protein